ncbi:MAG TPA: hypothetical protein VKZ50_01440 [bacterium]|nr:hypothetical protein [bacterium]
MRLPAATPHGPASLDPFTAIIPATTPRTLAEDQAEATTTYALMVAVTRARLRNVSTHKACLIVLCASLRLAGDMLAFLIQTPAQEAFEMRALVQFVKDAMRYRRRLTMRAREPFTPD